MTLSEGATAGSDLPVLRLRSGGHRPLPVHEWTADASPLEQGLLARIDGPVLDLGCGPGRLVAALAERGITALGVDSSPSAIGLARQRGAAVLERSVFDRLPGIGRWRTTILLDGNIGIGGDAARLLGRCGELLAPGGSALVEVDPPGHPTEVVEVRLEMGDHHGEWFPWALVGMDGLATVADAEGHRVAETWTESGRWFARIEPAPPSR